MNERVQDILKQATDDILGVKVVDQKKFAELIVRECGKVVYNYTNKTETHVLYNEIGWECLPGDLESQIEEHFGVD